MNIWLKVFGNGKWILIRAFFGMEWINIVFLLTSIKCCSATTSSSRFLYNIQQFYFQTNSDSETDWRKKGKKYSFIHIPHIRTIHFILPEIYLHIANINANPQKLLVHIVCFAEFSLVFFSFQQFVCRIHRNILRSHLDNIRYQTRNNEQKTWENTEKLFSDEFQFHFRESFAICLYADRAFYSIYKSRYEFGK